MPPDDASTDVVDEISTPTGADHFPHTDYGNAERLVAWEGDDLMYVPGPGWFAWMGKRWVADDDGRVVRRAKRTVRRSYEHGEQLLQADPDSDLAKALKKHARASESQRAITAMIRMAESELRLVARVDTLDADPWLLNVANGAIDLRTGDLHVPDRAHRITKWSPVVYDPAATDPHWERVLAHIDQGYDGTLREYLRLASGYSSTGSVREDVTHLAEGPGGTSKSTAIDSIRRSLGEYGSVASFDMFVQRKGDQAHPTDLAALMGARMVTAEEGPRTATSTRPRSRRSRVELRSRPASCARTSSPTTRR